MDGRVSARMSDVARAGGGEGCDSISDGSRDIIDTKEGDLHGI